MKFFNLISMVLGLGLWIAVSGCNAEVKEEVEKTESTSSDHELLATESVTYGIGSKSGRDTILISSMKFDPEHFTVRKGDTVVWVNNDEVVHNITVDSQGKSWSSDAIQPGGSWTKVIDGEFDYFSSSHSAAKGRINLSDN